MKEHTVLSILVLASFTNTSFADELQRFVIFNERDVDQARVTSSLLPPTTDELALIERLGRGQM